MKKKSKLLLALANRCEVEDAGGELHQEVAEALGWEKVLGYDCRWRTPGRTVVQCGFGPPPFLWKTHSAADLTDWVLLHASDIGADGLPLVVLVDPSVSPPREARGTAGRTLALTWCAASLRALADEEERKR